MALNKTGNFFHTNPGTDPGLLAQRNKPESPGGVSNTGQDVHNTISVQAGEKFSVEFDHDGTAVRRVPASHDMSRYCETRFGLKWENGDVGYEDLTNILGLKRMESESASDIADLISVKESSQAMENGAFVNILSKVRKEDGDSAHAGHALRKAVCESVSEQAGPGPTVSPVLGFESSHSIGFSGSGILDDSRSGKMKFLCSFGGKILPRPSDGKLRYVGGETHIISIRKDISWEELVKKTLGICSQPHTIKYQLPGEDLDALISVSSDEDLQNMVEEYYGIEKREGSQRPRIFLVPLGEFEETSSIDVIQGPDSDYQYVVAVNGIVDPNPRKNIGGQNLTNEASQLETCLNFDPIFQGISTNDSSPLEIMDGVSALNPDGFFNDSLNLQTSPPISPIPIEGGGSGTGYIQLLGNSSCQGSIESSTSFITAQLQRQNSSISTSDCRYPQQGAVNLLSDSHPYQHVDVGQPKMCDGRHFDNYSPVGELVSHVYVNPSNGFSDVFFGERPLHKERRFYSGNPLSSLDDPICQQAESNSITDSPYGIPHAFSDSQLHESGSRSGCCSQEGVGQSFSLNLEKARLSSMLLSNVSQGNLMQHQHDSIFLHPQIQSKIPNIESDGLQRRMGLAFSSPYSESLGMNDPVHKDSILTENVYPTAQTDISGSSFIVKDIQDNFVKLEKMKRIDENSTISKKDSKLYEEKSPAIDVGPVTELHCLDSFPADDLNAKINMQKNWELPSENIIPVSSVMMGLSLNNLVDKTLSGHFDMSQRTSDGKKSAWGEGLHGEKGIDFSLTRNFDLNGSILKCEESSCAKNSLGDLVFEPSIHSNSCNYDQIQPSVNQKGAGFCENMTVSSAYLYPAVLHDDPGPSLNLPMNDLDNPSKNNSFKKLPSFLDDLITSTDQMGDQFIHEQSASQKPKAVDIMSGQSKNLEKCNDANPIEPFVLVEDVTDVVSPVIESSSVPTLHTVVEIGSDTISLSPTEGESIVPESEPEDFKDDEAEKNEFLTDAMIAEMEASIHGLQVDHH